MCLATDKPDRPKPEFPVSAGSGGAGESCGQAGQRFTHKDDCSKFLTCVNGQKIEEKCIGGLYWNTEGYCDWKDNVVCGNRRDCKQS